jgi:hypothetical protein
VSRLLVGKPEERRALGRPRRGRLDNIRMDLVEVGWGDVDWIGLAQDRDSSCEFAFHKMLVNYLVFKQLGISRVALSSIELVSWLVLQVADVNLRDLNLVEARVRVEVKLTVTSLNRRIGRKCLHLKAYKLSNVRGTRQNRSVNRRDALRIAKLQVANLQSDLNRTEIG